MNEKEQNSKMMRRNLLLLAVAILVAVGGALLFMGEKEIPVQTAEVSQSPVVASLKTVVGQKSMTPAQVYAENVGAVVGIRTESTVTNVFGQRSSASCSGSGFLVSHDGYVVTNQHVVEGAQTISVSLYSGEEYQARLVGAYADNDVALLKIDANDLPCVTVGKAADLVVGEQVVAIGNPLGELTYSMTVGYVSALDRQINTSGSPINMLQTDVAINSGNSGGPLFDMNGNVIAIASAKYSGRSGSGAYIEGLSFAIPIDDVLEILSDLETYGYVRGRPYLGIGVREIDPSVTELYGLPSGVVVVTVEENGSGARAGLMKGDVLTVMNGNPIGSYQALVTVLRGYKAGDSVTVGFYRSGVRLETVLVLDEKDTRPAMNSDSAA